MASKQLLSTLSATADVEQIRCSGDSVGAQEPAVKRRSHTTAKWLLVKISGLKSARHQAEGQKGLVAQRQLLPALPERLYIIQGNSQYNLTICSLCSPRTMADAGPGGSLTHLLLQFLSQFVEGGSPAWLLLPASLHQGVKSRGAVFWSIHAIAFLHSLLYLFERLQEQKEK